MVQPLMYQTTDVTCWYASMINGIMLLRWRIAEKSGCSLKSKCSLLSPMEDRLLRSLTSQYTEFGANKDGKGRDWDSPDELKYYESAMICLATIGDFGVYVYRKGDVEQRVRELDFDREMVVCNIENGSHAILLHGKNNAWINCFDPFWSNVRNRETSRDFRLFPCETPTNLMIEENYLLSAGTNLYRMGGNYRFLTVLRMC